MLTIVIQSGGRSQRMGRDKGLVPFLGKPLIERVIGRVAHLGAETLVTTNNLEDYRFLGVPLFPDLIPERGALGGIYTALSAAQNLHVAVVACDMPFVNAELLAAELDLLVDTGSDAVIPRTEGGTEPFHAVYQRDRCLLAIQSAIEADKWRVDAWFPQVKLRYMSPEETAPYDPDQLAFWNVNTPEELQRAEQVASKGGRSMAGSV
jgi:molybdopterin-guanine dinucleotide biosynthesis protein A